MVCVTKCVRDHSADMSRPPESEGSGPFRIPSQQEAPPVCVLGAGPRGGGNGCVHPGLEPVGGSVCISPVHPCRQGVDENSPRQSAESTSPGTYMGDSGLVSHAPPHVSPRASQAANESVSTHATGGRDTSPARRVATSSRVDCLRTRYRESEISDGVTRVLLASWRPRTSGLYSSSWRRWSRWCGGKSLDPISAPLNKVLDFLYRLFDKGLQYRTINVYRSAISSTHLNVEGRPIGAHPLVSRFMKGVFELRPPVPKHVFIWDVSVVLKFLRKWAPAKCLSLKQLTLKVAMLVALVSAGRSQSLALLDTSHMSSSKDGLSFEVYKLTKTSRPDKPSHSLFVAKFEQKEVCPVVYLKAYLARTASFRSDSDSRVFRALVKPHKAVCSATIARWLKSVLSEASSVTKGFTGHSVRSAATSAARQSGVSVKDIMLAANWSSSSTFEKFYNKPSNLSHFGHSVLASASKSC
ncbi:uncharacterized protein LOC118404611 isoform X2 [Branchiostoma floridae]|nr:uncharacterized protein LOC118404611 isoform X2 [Branchiostoma floridae]